MTERKKEKTALIKIHEKSLSLRTGKREKEGGMDGEMGGEIEG